MKVTRVQKRRQPCHYITAVESDSDDDLNSLLDLSINESNNLILANTISRRGTLNREPCQQTALEQVLSNDSKRVGEQSKTRFSPDIEEVTLSRRDSQVSAVTFPENPDPTHSNTTDDSTYVSCRKEDFRNRCLRRRSISFNEKVDRLTYDGDSWTETSEVLASQLSENPAPLAENIPYKATRRNSICTSAPSREFLGQTEKKQQKKIFQNFHIRGKKKKSNHR